MEINLSSRVALVTGAGSGIGRDFARILAESGAAVAVMGRRAEQLAETVKAIEDKGGRALAVPGDVTSEEDVQRVMAQVKEWGGRLDILVNNAGIYPSGSIVKMPEDAWERTIDTNLTGVFRCTRHAVRLMSENGYGRIINITSPSSLLGAMGQSAYAASKAALNSFTKSSAAELGRRGITVNALLMGVVATDSFVGEYSPAAVDALAAGLPVKRAGTAEDAAGALVLLASEASSYITGAMLPVDGGMSNVMPTLPA
ncbi:3-oxoacyl-[acyl-carrier-protein] reductase [Streptomyces chlorus]|uniref:SDR family NAD(P)-dependent oxidoreductase n=1 Tax=Streptomyces chlorus TaxID=887452 RepID=A0ABW1DZR9_9ACTN